MGRVDRGPPGQFQSFVVSSQCWTAVALAYLALGPGLFTKSADGRIDTATRLLLLPYLAGAWINSRLWTRNEARSRSTP